MTIKEQLWLWIFFVVPAAGILSGWFYSRFIDEHNKEKAGEDRGRAAEDR